jgi:hypothetical protein
MQLQDETGVVANKEAIMNGHHKSYGIDASQHTPAAATPTCTVNTCASSAAGLAFALVVEAAFAASPADCAAVGGLALSVDDFLGEASLLPAADGG